MTNYEPERGFNPGRILQKFVVSTFVVCTFIAYALHEHFVSPDTQQTQALPSAPTPTQLLIDPPPTAPTSAPAPRSAATQPRSAPPPPPSPAIAGGQFKDGSYTGPEVDAFYGLVQVKAVIKNGKIANVQFLEYPNDRRTSVRINNVAVPYLQQEAVQVQSANVDIISGATLTSEAFAESLQAALDQAKNSS